MREKILLDWQNLQSIYSVNHNSINYRGVYIWGFTLDTEFVPYYVGIAENVISRIYEHVNSIIGGRYNIFHKEALKEFSKYKNHDPDIESKGKLFLPDWPMGYKNFLINRNNLYPHIDYMVDTFSFSFAIVNDKYSAFDLKCLEKICISKIGIENLINTRCGSSDRFELVHTGDNIIVDTFSNRFQS
jgi:hypothetical protein